jgi:hypothetical protein
MSPSGDPVNRSDRQSRLTGGTSSVVGRDCGGESRSSERYAVRPPRGRACRPEEPSQSFRTIELAGRTRTDQISRSVADSLRAFAETPGRWMPLSSSYCRKVLSICAEASPSCSLATGRFRRG